MTTLQKTLQNKIKLSFKNKETFRILCLSDVHGGVGYDKENTVRYVTDLLNKTNPDLVLMLGDIAGPGVIHIENAEQLRTMLTGLTAPLEERNIPWANVFGNHDDNYGLPNREAADVYASFPHCLAKKTEGTAGASDYVLPLYDETGEHILFAVYGLDSHQGMDGFCEEHGIPAQTPLQFKEHGNIDIGERGTDFAQVLWYYKTSQALEAQEGHRVPALAVMHVPVQEMCWASLNKEDCRFNGIQGEPVSGQAMNSGFFRACVERGDVKAMCFGHDHENNFSVEFGGITMAFDGYVSCHACHLPAQLGGRVFDIHRDDPGRVDTRFVNIGQ